MLPPINLPWESPLSYATAIPRDELYWVLLYSGQTYDHSGRYSFLGLKKKAHIKAKHFSALAESLTSGGDAFDNAWFGYLGYELRHDVESLPHDPQGIIDVPPLWMVSFHILLVFDHQEQRVTAWVTDESHISSIPSAAPIPTNITSPQVDGLQSSMPKEHYLENVLRILDYIRNGDIYQANLTRKFYGKLQLKNPFDLYLRLCDASPAPYSAYMKLDDICVVSSSPERFLTIDASGAVESRPIKGTARRDENPETDKGIREALANSEKDRSENLMIVDLMRNDLSRSCIPETVKVSGLFEITSYSTLHHMASTVSGQIQPEVSALDLVKRCFPPGSMTGAPKIRAMEICTELEQCERGIYSGAIGWFGGDGSCDLSVVIRTLVLKKKPDSDGCYTYEFQVGGAIVADSTPENEWEETRTKAQGVLKALGIDPDTML